MTFEPDRPTAATSRSPQDRVGGAAGGWPWLRVAGAALFLVGVSSWFIALGVVAPRLGMLLSVPCAALVGPGWTHPREGGAGLVVLAGGLGLMLLAAATDPLPAELVLVVPMLAAGLLLLADGLVPGATLRAGAVPRSLARPAGRVAPPSRQR